MAAGGGTIAYLGSSRRKRSADRSAWTTILVNCTPQEAYQFWRNFENLPLFMNRLETVSVIDDRRSRWIALGPMGREVHWDAEITGDQENKYIAWTSVPGSDLYVDGRVEFREAPAGRGTLISVRLEFRALPGMFVAPAKFLSKGANFAMRQDLRRLEALMEAGEIPTTEGQPHGPRDRVTAAMRLADPTRPIRPGTKLKDAFAARRRIA